MESTEPMLRTFDKIADAIRSGNVSALSAGFGANVEIGIKDAQNSYSKPQAEAVLKNFFGSHAPKSFAVSFIKAIHLMVPNIS